MSNGPYRASTLRHYAANRLHSVSKPRHRLSLSASMLSTPGRWLAVIKLLAQCTIPKVRKLLYYMPFFVLPWLLIHINVVVVSNNKWKKQFLSFEMKALIESKAASSSRQFICNDCSSLYHRLPVTTPLLMPPQPVLLASVVMVIAGRCGESRRGYLLALFLHHDISSCFSAVMKIRLSKSPDTCFEGGSLFDF